MVAQGPEDVAGVRCSNPPMSGPKCLSTGPGGRGAPEAECRLEGMCPLMTRAPRAAWNGDGSSFPSGLAVPVPNHFGKYCPLPPDPGPLRVHSEKVWGETGHHRLGSTIIVSLRIDYTCGRSFK